MTTVQIHTKNTVLVGPPVGRAVGGLDWEGGRQAGLEGERELSAGCTSGCRQSVLAAVHVYFYVSNKTVFKE